MKITIAVASALAAFALVSCTDLSNYYTRAETDALTDGTPVSFSVKLTSSYNWPYDGAVSQVDFHTTGHVVSNTGNAYNDSTSTFIVPDDGTYSFTGSVRFNSISQGDLIYVFLRAARAGVDTCNYYGDWHYAGGIGEGLSVTTTLALHAGTQVQLWAYVNATTPPAVVYGNTTSYYFTAFSGARVR